MDKLHNDSSTLSAKGRVSLSPEILPESHRRYALEKLAACLKGFPVSDEEEHAFLARMAQFFRPGMPLDSFRLQTAAAIPAWAQHILTQTLQQSENLRRHIRQTLARCIPACVVTDDLVTRCEQAVNAACPWDTGEIVHFAAGELLSSPTGKHPLLQRLHHSAVKLLTNPAEATRDDLRLVTLHALFEPHLLPQPYAGYMALRLGYHRSAPLSTEAVAAATHMSPTFIREVEEGALQALLTSINTEETYA